MSELDMNEVRKKLIHLFLIVQLRKTRDIEHLNDDLINKEHLKIDNLSLIDIVNHIYNSIDILIEIKAQERVSQHFEEKEEMKKYLFQNDEMSIYEPLLIKTEKETEQELKLRIEELEMELDQYERKKLSPNRSHSYICTTQYIINNPKRKSVSNNNSSNDFILVKNLQKENELLRNLIKTNQIKYEMLTSNNNNNSKTNLNNSINIQEHNKYQNNKINKLIVNTNSINVKFHNDKKQSLLTTTQKKITQNQKNSKTKQSSTSSTPKQNINNLSSLNNRFLNRSTKKIIQNTKVNSSRTSVSHLKRRFPHKVNSNQCSEINGNNTTIPNDIKNDNCIMINRKYNNFLEEFNTFKIVNFNKKENNNLIKRKTSAIIEGNKKVNLKRSGHMKYNSSISNSNGGGVIINNVNYINVFPSNYSNNNFHKMNVLKTKIKHANIVNKK